MHGWRFTRCVWMALLAARMADGVLQGTPVATLQLTEAFLRGTPVATLQLKEAFLQGTPVATLQLALRITPRCAVF
jgi:hypothetical protein